MDVAGTGINELRKGIDICAEELLQSSVVQDVGHDRSLSAELLQHLLRGDVLSRACLLRLLYELHLTEEDVAHLFRAGDIELLAGFLIDLLLQVGHTLCEQLGCLLERCRV